MEGLWTRSDDEIAERPTIGGNQRLEALAGKATDIETTIE